MKIVNMARMGRGFRGKSFNSIGLVSNLTTFQVGGINGAQVFHCHIPV